MKYLYLLLLTAGLYACTSSNKLNNNKLLGKLVISELCAHYVVEVVAGNIDASKTAEGWKDEKRNQTFKQSFSVANRCSFGKENLKEGDEFTFEIDNAPEQENCAVCMAYYPTPSQSLHIKNINKIQP
ncbi:MAG: hypothetical protein J0I84_08260 [Terrimonas sp.]|nr:hypothetical protein [Terrimonas sp.]OJY99762.1 MAG: hypothetical protein BGP13_08810 [Sphingobacteriales bacterium 40-81]